MFIGLDILVAFTAMIAIVTIGKNTKQVDTSQIMHLF